MQITQTQLESLLIMAVRYALGRTTYVTQEVLDLLIEYAGDINQRTRTQLAKEIQAAIDRDEAGMDMDVAVWREALEVLKNQ